jgi:ABC-type lipoprotein export system ATPase subunit
MNATLAAQSISKAFVTGKVRTDVLRDLSIEIFPAELSLVSGPSGCGKSTLLAILSGLLDPDSGMFSHSAKTLRACVRPRSNASACSTPASCSKASTCFPR